MLIENVPETLIQNGYIHPDYAEEVREFYQHLGDEDSTKSITVRVKSGESRMHSSGGSVCIKGCVQDS